MTAVLDRPGDTTVVRYEPRGAALALMKCREPVVCAEGPAGTGKTLGAAWKMHLSALNCKIRGLIVRQTHLALTSTTLVTFEELVIADALKAGIVRWFGGSGRQPPGYRYSNGSFIAVGGLDKPSKFLSSEFDRVMIDEATETTETALETLISRLRGRGKTYKQIILCCNPDAPAHWINQRADRGALVRLLSRHRDNPAFYTAAGELTERGADYMAKLNELTGVRRLRLLDGIWAAAEGIIYEEYDPQIHLVPKPEFHKDTRLCSAGMPWDWPRYWVIDFGYIHPFVLKRYAIDPDGRAWRYAEIYRTKRLVEDHAAEVMSEVSHEDKTAAGSVRRRVWTEPKPRKVICDHDAEGRATFEEKTGLTTTPAIKTVKDGIQKVQARLRVQPDGKPRLLLIQGARKHRDPELVTRAMPTCTEEEFGSYVWADSATKEEPVKVGDDGVDCDRYLSADLDRGQTKWMRWVA